MSAGFLDNRLPHHDGLRAAIDRLTRAPEDQVLGALLARAETGPALRERITARAAELVAAVRSQRRNAGGIDAFLHEFGLSSKEGVALMCLAEALLRIPDAETADRLIADKIGNADWEKHLGKGEGLFVNASTWALMLTGRVVELDREDLGRPMRFIGRLVKSAGEPVIREAMRQAMRILGRQFVMGRTIEEALARAEPQHRLGYRYSYDMLGEAARTAEDAARYFRSYREAIARISHASAGRGPIDGPGISIKLSALHPRYEEAQRQDCVPALIAALTTLVREAKQGDIGVCIDAEEAERLDLSLDIIEAVHGDAALGAWRGFGLAVQAYQKRALPVIDWLAATAERHGRNLMVRLVKGAYWDSEIKRAQERGLEGYPLFTRKASTDVSYLACARELLDRRDRIYPQFATHNAHSVAYVMTLGGESRDYEFQRLHGMGDSLYERIVGPGRPVRVYAPVGGHEDLLAYLVRRLLENGANTSFVNRLQDDAVPVERIVADPVAHVASLAVKPHPRIPLPRDLYRPDRANSAGIELSDPAVLGPLLRAMGDAESLPFRSGPMVGTAHGSGAARKVMAPADRTRIVGEAAGATAGEVDAALAAADAAWRGWDEIGGAARAAILERAADLLEADRPALMALAVHEAGKTLPDAIAEVREAADFCRYYAARARDAFAGPRKLQGPTGEDDLLSLGGRGTFACISPWNFPLAIFTGQVSAALAAGNAVIAKPAEQTPLIAARAVQLLREAGVPPDVLHLLPGDGGTVGGRLTADERIAGVAFTGSTDTAKLINRSLAERSGPIVPLIAETGGQNAMIVDSSALPEQVTADVLASAFQSAGQRCSALRVLFLQDDIADRTIEMIRGAAMLLKVGQPALLATDVGPMIDADAVAMLTKHAARMDREGTRLFEVPLGADTAAGTFFAPRAYEIDGLGRLTGEVFGPILHVIRYEAARLDQVLEAIEATGFALTLGIHTRIEETAAHITRRLRIGNTYINRNIIGAVVGVQPFGGHGLSGTGPKAGGPHYLPRFAVERSVSINTTAAGGNTSLVSMDENPAGM